MGHESCVAWDKAYFTKGQIYQALYESPVADYKKLDSEAVEKAWEAYQKVIELDVKKKYPKKLETQYRNLAIDFTNRAAELYNAKDFKKALASFKRVLEIKSSPILTANGEVSIDTAVIYNAGLCAQQAEEYAERLLSFQERYGKEHKLVQQCQWFSDAEKFLKESIKLNYEPAQSYAMLSNVLKQQGKTDEALEYLHKGYEQYPDNAYMLVELINHYLLGGEPEKAEVYLDAAIKQDPKNASFYRAKGTLYEKTERPAQAEEMYVKALELDPKDFLAQYNLGNIKLTEAINFHKKVQDIVDVNEYNKELEKVYIAYESVIPYFEKALELSPDEKNTLATLRELYFKLRNQKPEYQQRYDEIKQKLEAQ